MARAIFKDPFRGGDNILVMCDAYEPPRVNPDGTVTAIKPIPTNTRAACAEVMEKCKAEEPWFGIEQASRSGGVGGHGCVRAAALSRARPSPRAAPTSLTAPPLPPSPHTGVHPA